MFIAEEFWKQYWGGGQISVTVQKKKQKKKNFKWMAGTVCDTLNAPIFQMFGIIFVNAGFFGYQMWKNMIEVYILENREPLCIIFS